MASDAPLQERFWRDVAVAAGHADSDPTSIREAIEDMMRNYRLQEVPGLEAPSEADEPDRPDAHEFSKHSAFAPVFSRRPSLLSSWSCFRTDRPIRFRPRCLLRRRRSQAEPRDPDHFPNGANPGIQPNADQPDVPIQASYGVSPSSQLPPWMPYKYVWWYPAGHLAWTPHPQATLSIPQPLSPWSATTLTQPGTIPQWALGTWPPPDWTHTVPIHLSPHVIPNPNNTHVPLIDWNVTKHPSTAKRLTPNHVVVDMDSIWSHTVTDTDAHTVVVTCDVGHLSTLWGPIWIERGAPVTVRDLCEAVHDYVRVPLTHGEVRYICDLHPSNYRRLTDAYDVRCRESAALPAWEAKQGFRRADVLGDRTHWGGVWIASRRGAWWLNLGLVPRGPCA